MLKNYFTIARRNLLKHKVYTSVNVIGLAVGIISTLFIIFYLRFEFSFDNFHKDSDNIYRVSIISSREGKVERESPVFVPPIGPELKQEFPEVKQYTRFSTPRTIYYESNNKYFKITENIFADSTFFRMLSFNLISGNPSTVLTSPYSIVLTKSTAAVIFGKENPVGQILKNGNNDLYKVTGIVRDPPENSEIQFKALLSFSSLYKNSHNYMGWNGGNQYYTYVKLSNQESKKQLTPKLAGFMWEHINKKLARLNIKFKAYLQPLEDIHLKYNEGSQAGLSNIYIFSAIAFLIIIIACINFINLSIARSVKRTKEIGVRKILGAGRNNLFVQFISEYILISAAVLFVVVVGIELLFPVFKSIAGYSFNNLDLYSPGNIAIIVGIIFLVGVIAGGYPAIYLSSLQPVDSIKGEIKYRDKKISTRNVLLVSQFAISIALIISTIFISKQLSFVSKKNLGFDKSNILVLPLLNSESKENLAELRNSLTSISGVKYVSGSSDIPYNNFTSNGYIPEGFTTPVMIHVVDTDHNFLEAYGIKLSEGRSFIPGMTSDSSAYLINEALAKQLGWDNPIGKTITRNGKHKIIGLVKNFNYSSLHSQIGPLIITEKPYSNLFSFVSVKISPDNISGTLAQIKKSWDKSNHTSVFEYSFLSDEINQLYKPENNFRQIFLTFASVAIILALFGLFSLASLSTEQKTKEIGIRKVLGDTSAGITIRLLKEYFVFVIIANIIAWPLAYYFINSWLNNFVYRININWLLFLATGVITLLVAMGTVIWQAIRAASADPVKSIRYE